MGRFLSLGAFLEGRLGASWGFSEASGAALRPSWASWRDLSAARGPLDAFWESLWALLACFRVFAACCGHGDEKAGGAGEHRGQGRVHGAPYLGPRIWANFLSEKRKTQGLGAKK